MPAGYHHTEAPGHLSDRRIARLDTYRTRFMLSLVASLGLATLAVRVPLTSGPERIGWDPSIAPAFVEVSESATSAATRQDGGSVESFGVPDTKPTAPTDPTLNADGSEELDSRNVDVRRMSAKETAYEFVDTPPQIRGGLGAYYINIQYPEEAVRLGIEGRLLLRFIVDTEGRPTNITVRQSLHPLCDSAAVRALRMTRFVAGSQNGEKVPVRMHLPVRFRLVEAGTLARRTDTLGVRLTE